MTSSRLGLAAVLGAVLAIIGNAMLFVVDPQVPENKLSWPLTPHAYVFMQLFFALTQLLLGAGILGLVRSDIVRPGRGARVLGALAVVGMALTVPGELVLILVRGDDSDASAVNAVSGVFGTGALLADIGLIGLGILALRQRRWSRAWAALPLVLGLFQLLVVTTVSFSQGFTSVASNVVIGIADAMTALIGVRVMRGHPMSTATESGLHLHDDRHDRPEVQRPHGDSSAVDRGAGAADRR